jgi:hypothetical protein
LYHSVGDLSQQELEMGSWLLPPVDGDDLHWLGDALEADGSGLGSSEPA